MASLPERSSAGSSIEALRVPPHSVEAEQSVLGGLMLSSEAYDKVADRLTEEDFYRRDHRLIYRAISQLSEKGMPCDAVTLGEWFEGNQLADVIGGSSYLIELANATPSAANISAYADIVREKSVLRQLIDAGTSIAEDGYRPDGRGVQEVLEAAEQRVFHIAEAGARGRKDSVSMRDAVKEAFRILHHRYENRGQLTGLPSGFNDLDEMTAGLQPSDLIIVAARPSMGKAQPLDARIKTLTGWKRMDELEVGDALASVDGQPSMVTGLFPQGERQVYRIRFSDGRSTECCDEHLWRVHYRGWDAPRTLNTGEIRELLTRKRYQRRLWIDLPSGDFGRNQALPIDSWVLGALLGDGSMRGTSLRFSVKEASTLECMRERVDGSLELRHAGQYDWRIVRVPSKREVRPSANPLMQELKQLGLWDCSSHDKFIPRVYLDASRAQRLDLLRGLLDTDGWVESWGTIRYSSASLQLAQDLCELVRSLGGWCTIKAKATSYTWRDERHEGVTAYVCTISHPDPASLFLFEGKRERLKSGRVRRKFPVIESIEPSRCTATQCIAVSHPSHLYITDDYVVTHNTAFSVNIAESAAIRSKKAVVIFSMEMSASQLAFRLISSMGRIHQQHLRTGDLAEEDWPRVTSAITMLSEAKIFIDDTPALSPVDLRSRSRRLQREHGELGLIVIDYLQLMQVPGNKENRATEISEISRGLKALAKELNVPVIALSQLNRSLEQRADKRPMMSDLRESGAIEQDADVILFIYRDEYYNPDSPDKGLAEIIIGKQRNGPTGTVKLTFLGHFTKFENYAPESFSGAFE